MRYYRSFIVVQDPILRITTQGNPSEIDKNILRNICYQASKSSKGLVEWER